ncbi:DUF485 domain-containing protein [Ornithinibacillus contaminans]|uniref:DUF485 domain-containing protein n=1 Tax=Ornithinibacillus contaminans TaxID=694055 RepID=UPI00064DAA20|nr:DUF485 domain-containing protein [Ornithinibacillus contaminans]
MEERLLVLIHEKRRMMLLSLGIVFLFYFSLPLSLIFFPDMMNRTSFIYGVTWAWLYSFLQIPMTWIMGILYHRKANVFEQKIKQMKREEIL